MKSVINEKIVGQVKSAQNKQKEQVYFSFFFWFIGKELLVSFWGKMVGG